jgi:hypothetical protein
MVAADRGAGDFSSGFSRRAASCGLFEVAPLSFPFSTIAPCLPRPAKESPIDPGWIHEIKLDGFRILARKHACALSAAKAPSQSGSVPYIDRVARIAGSDQAPSAIWLLKAAFEREDVQPPICGCGLLPRLPERGDDDDAERRHCA